MNDRASSAQRARFGCFEADLRSGELRKQGLQIKLQEKPFQMLAVLLERAGEVVTREELRQRLWPADTFVDFDANLNTALNKLRQALGDSAESPRFVQTIPRRGYCFIAPVEPIEEPLELERSLAAPPAFRGRTLPSNAKAVLGRFPTIRPLVAAVSVVAVALFIGALHFLGSRSEWVAKPRVRRATLLVVPFENLSGDPEQEYFSEGLTEEMITQIGKLQPRRLGVLARASAREYKGTHKTLAQFARELGVDYVLEGSVRRINDRLRITAQLIQVRDQTELWAESYERNVADVFTIQREVAGHVAQSLALELLAEHNTAPVKKPPVNAEAHEEYLKGRYHWNKRTGEGLQKGLEHFQLAIRKDPRYAPAYAGLADSYVVLANWGLMPPTEAYPKAREAAMKALALDDQLAEAHTSLAATTWEYDRDWGLAQKEFLRALEINPGYASGRQWYAEFLSALGRHEEAIAEISKAREADPLSLIINAVTGLILYDARRYDQALEACRNTVEMDPRFKPAHTYLGWVYIRMGRYADAVRELQEAQRISGASGEEQASLQRAYEREGIQGTWRWLLSRSFRRQGHYASAYHRAVLFAELGEREQALEWLEKAYEQRDVALDRIKVDARLDPLRPAPRFRDLVRRLGVPP
ncbi:MAG TPA: winged helix-turn-helix domain-containing protein [Candidatus Acidoferrales bacterium]|nr:winged helix-turn-helix domain-containing protein [Candidatus Acidoferrales bacterium]